MRLATLVALADKHRVRLPDALTKSWPPTLSAADERGWFRFQRLYDMARACVRDEADMRRIVREAAQDDAAEGSRWLEIQVDPTSYAPFVGGITPAVRSFLEARSVVDYGLVSGRRGGRQKPIRHWTRTLARSGLARHGRLSGTWSRARRDTTNADSQLSLHDRPHSFKAPVPGKLQKRSWSLNCNQKRSKAVWLKTPITALRGQSVSGMASKLPP